MSMRKQLPGQNGPRDEEPQPRGAMSRQLPNQDLGPEQREYDYADDAAVSAALAAAQLPVGSVFLTIGNTDPGTLLGYGTWALRASGLTLVGA